MPDQPPAHQTATFDQAHAGYAREIDKLIAAWRDIRAGSPATRELDIAGFAGFLNETPNDRLTFVELLTVAVVRLADQPTPADSDLRIGIRDALHALRCPGNHELPTCGALADAVLAVLAGQADSDLRDRYAEAILRAGDGESVGPHSAADAVLAVRDTELERWRDVAAAAQRRADRLKHELEEARVEHEALRIAAAGAEGRVDLLIKAVARVRSMADELQRRFPGEAWSASASEAIHIATDIKGVTS